MEAVVLWVVLFAGCSASAAPERRGVIEDIEGCELSRIGRGWRSVHGKDMVIIASGRMRYATVRVHQAESPEAVAADVVAGRFPEYADDQVVARGQAAKVEIGGTEYPAWWVGAPNVMAYVFVPSSEEDYVFVVRVDLPRLLTEKTEDWKQHWVGRLLRPLVRSLETAPVDSLRKCLPKA